MPADVNKLLHLVNAFGTPRELSRRLKINRTTIYLWLQGKRQPTLEHQRAIIRMAPSVGMSCEEAAECVGAERVPARVYLDEAIDDLVRGSKRMRRTRTAA
jgi:hypothetical protein